MSEAAQIIFGLIFLIGVYIFTRYGVVWRMKRAVIFVIKDLERSGAFGPSTGAELPYAKTHFFNIGIRDFKPKALQSLIQDGIVGTKLTPEGITSKRGYRIYNCDDVYRYSHKKRPHGPALARPKGHNENCWCCCVTIDEGVEFLIQKKQVPVHSFRVQRSAPPLTAEAASLIEKETPALRSQIRGLMTKKGLKTRSRR